MGKRRRQNEEVTEAPASGQVLPVAELGDDFNGDAEDGATYLALAKCVLRFPTHELSLSLYVVRGDTSASFVF